MSYLREILRDGNVAAVSASSRYVVRRVVTIVAPIAPRRIIELGPGDGVTTFPLLAAAPPDCRYTAVESNPHFANQLAARNDANLELIRGDAVAEIERIAVMEPNAADAVIASIPFTYLSPADRQCVLAAAHAALRPGGALVIFHQYSPLMFPTIKKMFGTCRIAFEPLNLPPCFILWTTRAAA